MNTTVIIPTTGADVVKKALDSVMLQTRPCMVLLVHDGGEATFNVERLLGHQTYVLDNLHHLKLSENVGANNWYGHRVYASVPMLVNTPYVSFLDQDNWIEPDFIEIMEKSIERLAVDVVTCRRNVVTQEGVRIGRDNRESIGKNEYGYMLHDTNTYLFRQSVAHKICPAIYGQWGADRQFTERVIEHGSHVHLSQYYGVNYRSPERLYKHFEEVCK